MSDKEEERKTTTQIRFWMNSNEFSMEILKNLKIKLNEKIFLF